MGTRTNTQVHIRSRYVQIGKKSIGHGFVIVLASMDQYVLQKNRRRPVAVGSQRSGKPLVMSANGGKNGCGLHEVGARTYNRENLNGLCGFVVVHGSV